MLDPQRAHTVACSSGTCDAARRTRVMISAANGMLSILPVVVIFLSLPPDAQILRRFRAFACDIKCRSPCERRSCSMQ